METTIMGHAGTLYNIGVINNGGYIGMMENNMEMTIMGLGYAAQKLFVSTGAALLVSHRRAWKTEEQA